MLRFLFPRLTPSEPRGAALFQAVVGESRKPDWYRDLGIPDTIDGRFSVLATVTALVSIRLEQGSADAQEGTVALTERFIETMDAEHRQLGLGDPTLGKVVRKLVGALSRRIDLWRTAIGADGDWTGAAQGSLESPDPALAEERLQTLWRRLQGRSDQELMTGQIL